MNLSNLNVLKDDGKENRDILSREGTDIIKTPVNQDVTCDLQSEVPILEEKKDTEANVTVQMELEELSGRLDEIRHKPEIIRKVNNICEMVEFLKKLIVGLKETLSRCQSDNAALSLAMEKFSQEIQTSVSLKNKEKELEDSKKLIDNMNADIQMKTNMLRDLSKSNEELKSKLMNKEAFSKRLLEQNNELSETLVEVKGQHLTLNEHFKSLKFAHDNAIATTENLKLTVAQLDKDKKQLNNTVNDKEEIIREKIDELLNLKEECEKTDQLFIEMKEEIERRNKLFAGSKEAFDGMNENLVKMSQENANERKAYEERYNAVVKANEEKTATIEALQAELNRVTDAALNKKLNLDVMEGMRREKKPMAMEDLKQQGEQPSSSRLDQFDKDKECKTTKKLTE